MGRWTQYDEDSYRLPAGLERIGYDADTGKYTFEDRGGVIYESAPWSEYGPLTPVSRPRGRRSSSPSPSSSQPKSHPSRSATTHTTHSSISRHPRTPSSDSSDFNKKTSVTKPRYPTTFHDILPPSSIATSPSDSDSSGSSPTSPCTRFVVAARKTALPKMQGVVTQLRRSVTSARRPGGGREKEFGGDEDGVKVGLLRSQSTVSRSSMGSVRSGESFGKEKKKGF